MIDRSGAEPTTPTPTPTPTPTGLALERRLAVLSLPTLFLAAAAAVLMQSCEIVIRCVTFPEEMRARFLALYGLGSFGVLKLIMMFTFCTELVRRQRDGGGTGFVPRVSAAVDAFVKSLPATRKAVLYRGKRDWSIADSLYGSYGIIYCAFFLICIFSAYFDTIACYTKGRRYYAGGGTYEACSWFGARTDDFAHCKTARIVLFLLQMLSLVLTILPAATHGLAFAFTAYKFCISFSRMDKQLKYGRVSGPEFDDELHALEAQDKIVNGGTRQGSNLGLVEGKTGYGSKVRSQETVKSFETSEKQWGPATTLKKD